MSEVGIRRIKRDDDSEIGWIIRAVMHEFGASGPGFSSEDPELDSMFDAYAGTRAAYFVAEEEGRLLGGGGIGPLRGAPDDTCELRKMYLLPEARGRGVGRSMLARCLDAAKSAGYAQCFLETLERMEGARRMYENAGFRRISQPLGDTGHSGCDWWYVLELDVGS